MMWVGCWFWSNRKIRKPKFVRKPWTKQPWYVQVHWGLYTSVLHMQIGWSMQARSAPEHTNPGSHRTNRLLCLQRNYPCIFGVLLKIWHNQPDLIQVTQLCPHALAKAGGEHASCFGTISLAKYARTQSSIITLTLALLYNKHKQDRRDEKEVKTTTNTANNHLLIGITNQLLLFNILIAGDSSLKPQSVCPQNTLKKWKMREKRKC